jgi:hypothetical protein
VCDKGKGGGGFPPAQANELAPLQSQEGRDSCRSPSF